MPRLFRRGHCPWERLAGQRSRWPFAHRWPAGLQLIFDIIDADDRADFDRLAEIYAEDAQWLNSDPKGPHCGNRDDIFTIFRQRMDAGIRIAYDELRSIPTRLLLTARINGSDPVVTVFSFQGRRIVTVKDSRRWRPPRQRSRVPARHQLSGSGAAGGQDRAADPGRPSAQQ